MKLTRKAWVCLLAVSMLAVILVGCSAPAAQNNPAPSEQDKSVITFKGLPDGDKALTVGELKEMEPFETDALGISSSGEESTHAVVGVLLADLLESWGVNQKGLTTMSAVAGDGYSVEIPAEVLQGDIILAYEYDGEPLYEESGPIRLIVPGQRSLFWVRNLASLVLGGGSAVAGGTAQQVVFMETAFAELESHDYTYYESTDQAVKVTDLFTYLGLDAVEGTATVRAADGFEKSEQISVLKQGYLKHTGAEAPAFVSPDLPKGMHVKQVLLMNVGGTALVSYDRAAAAWEQATQDDLTGVALTTVLEQAGVSSETGYVLKASDDYTVEISAADAAKGLVYIKDGKVRVVFAGLEKSTSVKGLLSITAK